MYGGILHSGSLEMTFFCLFVCYIYIFLEQKPRLSKQILQTFGGMSKVRF